MQPLVTTTLLLMTVAVGCHSPATALNASERDTPLPDAKDVKTVAIKFDHPELDDVEFTATPEDWMAIRTGLLPAKVDPKPSLWEWFATVLITKNDGQQFEADFYALPYATGAFSIDKTYYRGGNSPDLARAVIAAYDKSRKQDTQRQNQAMYLSRRTVRFANGEITSAAR